MKHPAGAFSSSPASLEAARAARVKGQSYFQFPLLCPPSHPAMPQWWLGAPQPRVLVLGAGAVCFGRKQALSAEPLASFPQPTL